MLNLNIPQRIPKEKAEIFCSFFSACASKLKAKSLPLLNFVWRPKEKLTFKTDKLFQFQYVSPLQIEKKIKMLKKNKPEIAKQLMEEAQIEVNQRWKMYEYLAARKVVEE